MVGRGTTACAATDASIASSSGESAKLELKERMQQDLRSLLAPTRVESDSITFDLSPYSPDFSPIENCWLKVKEVSACVRGRTSAQLDQATSMLSLR